MDRKELKEIIRNFNLFDTEYFKVVFDEKHIIPLSQVMLRTIIGRCDPIVTEAHLEHEVSNIMGRGIRMDIRALDLEKTVYNVEMQRRNSGAKPKRARFNSSLIDANYPEKGDGELKSLPVSYVIFITEEDVLKHGLALYHIERVVVETGEFFGDGAHIIYVNGAFDDTSTEIGRLIHDLRCPDAGRMFFPELAERTHEIKEVKEATVMSEAFERFVIKEGARWIIKTCRGFKIPDTDIITHMIDDLPCTHDYAVQAIARYDAEAARRS